MNLQLRPVALPPVLRRILAASVAIGAIFAMATPALALTQSWNGYRWARTGPLDIKIGNNLSSIWASYLQPAATAWSAADNIAFTVIAGTSTASTCNSAFGNVQVCSSNYGANGWLGYASVWLSGGFITQATVKLNDYYFAMDRYNTVAWRQMVICQEIGHTLGLAHTNTIRTNLNTGSCMDYTNDPTGTKGTNGTLANIAPNNVDFAALNGIYATTDSTQLFTTRPTHIAGEGFGIDEHHHMDSFVAVPEPQSWALLIAGFGGIGAALRRRRSLHTATA